MTFTEWLEEQRNRTDVIGDFAVSVAGHPNWPKYADGLAQFSAFVDKEFGDGAVEALKTAWREFEAKTGRGMKSSITGHVSRTRSHQSPRKASNGKPAGVPPPPSAQAANFWAGDSVLDKARLPMKPPGRA